MLLLLYTLQSIMITTVGRLRIYQNPRKGVPPVCEILSECRTPENRLLFYVVVYCDRLCISIKQYGLPGKYLIPLDALESSGIVTARLLSGAG